MGLSTSTSGSQSSTSHTRLEEKDRDRDTASKTQTTEETRSTQDTHTSTLTHTQVLAALDSDEVVKEEEEEDLSDVAVAARHEGMLKKMRDRWALLQRLRMERKHALLGVPFQWVEGE
jgi:hypothetical protein